MTTKIILKPETEFASLDLPFPDVVLLEVFFIPPFEPPPVTVRELSQRSEVGLDETMRLLREIIRLSRGVCIDAKTLASWQEQKRDMVLLRCEEIAPYFWGIETWEECSSPALRKKTFIVHATPEKKAYSSAMYLRQEGFVNAFYTC